MRSLPIVGTVLVLVGVWLIIRPPTLPHQEKAFKLGDFQATFAERRPLPSWVGGAVLGAGLVLVVMGLKRS
jgi:hypothetical protein